MAKHSFLAVMFTYIIWAKRNWLRIVYSHFYKYYTVLVRGEADMKPEEILRLIIQLIPTAKLDLSREYGFIHKQASVWKDF